jgi:hypothetical protein
VVVSGFWLKRATAAEFEAVYDAATWPTYADDRGRTLLPDALTNRDPEVRALMVRRLVDDGADAAVVLDEGYTVLHVLLGQRARDPEVDPGLVRHLIAAGADPNREAGRHLRRPVEEVDHPKLSPAEHEPYYRAFFDQPGLELLDPGRRGRSVLDAARLHRFRRPQLFEHVMAYLERIDAVPVGEPLTRTSTWQRLDEVLAVYTASDAVSVDPDSGDTLLHAVLRNPDLDVRTELVPRLLADGADVTARNRAGQTPLHLALDRSGERVPVRDAGVVAALLAAGADGNAQEADGAVPLTLLAGHGNSPEDRLGPLYDALLAAPGLDTSVVVATGRTVLDVLRTARPPRPVLLARAEALGA